MKKNIIALSVAISAALLSSSAFALDGGQLDFGGLVSDNTCIPHVNGGSQDALIQLNTAKTGDIAANAGVQSNQAGVQPESFYITVDCGSTSQNATAKMTMGSTFFSNSNGTLNNDDSITTPAAGVNLAIHQVDASGDAPTYSQMIINNPNDIHLAPFASGVAKFNFVVSYVKQATAVQVAPGYVKSNAAYTLSYE